MQVRVGVRYESPRGSSPKKLAQFIEIRIDYSAVMRLKPSPCIAHEVEKSRQPFGIQLACVYSTDDFHGPARIVPHVDAVGIFCAPRLLDITPSAAAR